MKNHSKIIVYSLVLAGALCTVSHVDGMLRRFFQAPGIRQLVARTIPRPVSASFFSTKVSAPFTQKISKLECSHKDWPNPDDEKKAHGCISKFFNDFSSSSIDKSCIFKIMLISIINTDHLDNRQLNTLTYFFSHPDTKKYLQKSVVEAAARFAKNRYPHGTELALIFEREIESHQTEDAEK